jgi:hypothetical protein
MKPMISSGAMQRGRRFVRCAVLAFAALSVLLSPALLLPWAEARASVSIAVSFDSLLRAASAVVVGTVGEQRAVWEGGRIYTYSRVHVDTAVAGELAEGSEVWVRTMGGIVGNVGQIVEGEAAFTVGRPSLLFLRRGSSPLPGPTGASHFVVAARAQGQFLIYADDASQLRVRKSSAVGGLVPATGTSSAAQLAADRIDGHPVADAARDIALGWTRAHSP